MHNPESVSENEMHKLLWDFEIQTDHLISAQRLSHIINSNNKKKKKKKKRACRIVDFAVPIDRRVKLKESEKIDKYQDLARELKKLWNMKVTVMPIDAIRTVSKGLIQGKWELGNKRTSWNHPLLKLARILRRVRETCCPSDSSEKPLVNAGGKHSKRSKW